MLRENKIKITMALLGITASMDSITFEANKERIKLIEDILMAEPTDEINLKGDINGNS